MYTSFCVLIQTSCGWWGIAEALHIQAAACNQDEKWTKCMWKSVWSKQHRKCWFRCTYVHGKQSTYCTCTHLIDSKHLDKTRSWLASSCAVTVYEEQKMQRPTSRQPLAPMKRQLRFNQRFWIGQAAQIMYEKESKECYRRRLAVWAIQALQLVITACNVCKVQLQCANCNCTVRLTSDGGKSAATNKAGSCDWAVRRATNAQGETNGAVVQINACMWHIHYTCIHTTYIWCVTQSI